MIYKTNRVENVEITLTVLSTSEVVSPDNLMLKEWIERQVDVCDVGYNVGSIWELGVDVEFECRIDRIKE